ncbi:uncharacterized protein F5891DRAFT_1171931 [Suillus fuscotomentosus]|uniref:DUF6533 domain-containing protein n=1 Tax=Suillus fuscotomentosus TaxID=1912939 RepID=A0AAD4EAW2_9AGAM|nr:uncharacterized protein F5891DRAFT_1171931 [Suillus fuscotomentosus]KAG1902582.1 hypothetical protein F5891DRAFT_1171931 [Suillus fuscotomentosus]
MPLSTNFLNDSNSGSSAVIGVLLCSRPLMSSIPMLIQLAVAVAVLYDHSLTFAREIDYIWRRPPSIVAALYLLDRYLGDSVVIIGVYLCLTEDASTQVRAWGTLLCIMQLRIYAMYRRTRRILMVLVFAFSSEVFAVIVIIWRTIGPASQLVVTDESPSFPGQHLCTFSGINADFTYLFIPVFCFELLLFFLAIRVSLNNMRERKATPGTSSLRVNSFMSILGARQHFIFLHVSVILFLNLAMCVIVMSLWRNAAALHANISIPFIMLVQTIIGTRMVINFKEHCSRRLNSEPVMITGSIHFAGVGEESARQVTNYDHSNEGDEEMQPVKSDEESTEVIIYEEL